MSQRSPREVDPSDEVLATRAIARDQTALTAIYKRHNGAIAGLVYRMLGGDSDLDDLVQETFVEGFRCLGSLSDRTKVLPFLRTIAVRKVNARLAWRYRVRGLAARLFAIAPRVSDPAAREPIHALYRILAQADGKKRVAWVLHRIEGMTLPEVSDQIEVSLATTKRWIATVDAMMEEVPNAAG